MKTLTFTLVKFAIAILISMAFVGLVAGVYQHKPPSQMER